LTESTKPKHVSFAHSRFTQVHAPAHFDMDAIADLLAKFDAIEQCGAPVDFCVEALKRLLTQPLLDTALIIDIASRLPSQKLMDIFEPAISLESVDSLFEVCEVVDTGLLDQLYLLRRIRDLGICTFPLRNCLVSHKRYDLCASFCTFFRFHVNCTQVLREEAIRLAKAGEQVEPLLQALPTFRTEILESLPTGYRR
jgi:hypothetical protein